VRSNQKVIHASTIHCWHFLDQSYSTFFQSNKFANIIIYFKKKYHTLINCFNQTSLLTLLFIPEKNISYSHKLKRT